MAKVHKIYIATEKGGEMELLIEARFIVGKGIEGDRYKASKGSFSYTHNRKGVIDHVTLYSWEDVEAISRRVGRSVAPILRRNVFIRGFPMRAFLEARLARIVTRDGYVVLEWSANCSPCPRPGELGGVDPDALQRAMYDHGYGGERVAVVKVVGSGIVQLGDLVEIIEDNLPSFSRRR